MGKYFPTLASGSEIPLSTALLPNSSTKQNHSWTCLKWSPKTSITQFLTDILWILMMPNVRANSGPVNIYELSQLTKIVVFSIYQSDEGLIRHKKHFKSHQTALLFVWLYDMIVTVVVFWAVGGNLRRTTITEEGRDDLQTQMCKSLSGFQHF